MKRLILVLAAFFAAPSVAHAANPPDPTCHTNGPVRAIDFVGSVAYIGGSFSAVNGQPRDNLAACIDNEVLAWSPRADGEVRSIDATTGPIYVGGRFTHLNGLLRPYIGQVGHAGAVKTGWDPHANKTVYVVRIGPSGLIYAGGGFTHIGGEDRSHIAALSPTTGNATGFHLNIGQTNDAPCPPRCPPQVFTIAFADNKVYFGGHFGTVNGQNRDEAAAVTESGALTAFNPDIYSSANCPGCPTVETSRVYTIIPDNGKIITCGGYWKVNASKRSFNVSRFNATTGVLDPSLRVETDGDTPACALHGNVLYIGGHFNRAGVNCEPDKLANCSGREHVAAANVTTNSLLSWNPRANSVHGVFTAQSSGTRVGFGGFFTRFGGQDQQGFAEYVNPP